MPWHKRLTLLWMWNPALLQPPFCLCMLLQWGPLCVETWNIFLETFFHFFIVKGSLAHILPWEHRVNGRSTALMWACCYSDRFFIIFFCKAHLKDPATYFPKLERLLSCTFSAPHRRGARACEPRSSFQPTHLFTGARFVLYKGTFGFSFFFLRDISSTSLHFWWCGVCCKGRCDFNMGDSKVLGFVRLQRNHKIKVHFCESSSETTAKLLVLHVTFFFPLSVIDWCNITELRWLTLYHKCISLHSRLW